MASVAAAYRDAGLFEQAQVRFITTASPAGAAHKLLRAGLAWLQLLSWLLRRRVALVHIHVASGVSFWRKAVYVWTAWALRAPVLLHVHGGNFAEFAAGLGTLSQALLRSTFRRASRVVVLSSAWAQRLAPWVVADRVRVLANPVMPWRLEPRRSGERPLQRLLFVGRLEADKGVHVLLEAFAQLLPQQPGLQLWLAGDGDVAGTQAQAQRLGIPAAQLRFLGWVSGTQKRQAFDEADVYVSPSFIEGLPVAMLEAMHSGLPLVVTAVGSVPETIEDGREGVLVPPADAQALAAGLRRVLGDSVAAQAMAHQARLRFDAHYSAPVVLAGLRRCYAELVRDKA